MRIVHVEDFFHPDAGYQINILPKYMAKLGHEVIIVTSEMKKIPEDLTSFFGRDNIEQADLNYTKTTGVRIIRLPLLKFVSGRAIFKKNLIEKVSSLNPSIVYVHGNDTFTGIRFLLNQKKLGFPIIMDSHMLEMAAKNKFSFFFRKFYKNFITPIIVKNNIKVIRTQNDSYVEEHLGIPLHQSPWISVGSDTMLFYPDNIAKKRNRSQYNISENDFVVLYTGKLDESKGGKLLAETFKKKISSKKYSKIVLIVVGNTSGTYGQIVDEIFKQSENEIIRIPTQKYINLPDLYKMADLSVFPKQCSLSFFDAQACGLPVIAEENNINNERLMFQNGLVFKAGNMKDFRNKINDFVNMDEEKINRFSQNSHEYARKNYDYKTIADKYMQVITNEYMQK
ncbi:glycosyltransferase family 4 protein [Planococcus plakortidis]|uniref:glycosyltransferase family 4 protein n=1 Tax=Planococcus plakortidis TaxID=1038856 RepID=UPI00385DD8D5